MKSTSDSLGRWEKAKWGNLWDWIKSKVINTYFFILVGGYSIVNIQRIGVVCERTR